MECFEPGAEYGCPYRHAVWVCVNPAPRSFEKCDVATGHAVVQAFKRELQAKGLSREAMVVASGCMMGCRSPGTMVALASGGAVRYLRHVTPEDVPTLVAKHLG